MKRNNQKFAGLLAVVLGVTTTALADYPSTVSSLGPVGYWRLNETTQPAAADVAVNSGSLGDGAVAYYQGAASHPTTGVLNGRADTAAAFDASAGTFAFVPYNAALNPAGAFSAEAWLNPAVENAAGTLTCAISSGQFAAPRSGWLIYQSDTGWNLRMYNQNGTATSLSITGGGAPVPGAWHHLVVSFDGTNATLYVNGKSAATGTPTGTPNFVPGASGGFAIAGRADSSFFWNGSADEVAIYPKALSEAEVTAHYANATSAAPAATYQSLVLAAQPLAYYRLNEGTYTAPTTLPVAANTGSGGTSLNGSYNAGMKAGAPGPQPPIYSGFAAGNVGGGFNGSAGYVGTPYQLNDLTEFSVSGWVKRGKAHSGRGGYFGQNNLLEFGDADGGANIELWVDARSANIKAPYPFADDEWGLFVITADTTSTVLYANGKEIGRLDGGIDSYKSSDFNFNIGGGGIFNNTGDYFLGSIDEVAVFGKALTPSQVLSLYYGANVTPVITSQPTLPARPVYAGYTISMSVAAAGTPPISYQWRRGGKAITGQTSATLSIPAATAAEAGSYDVVVSNPYGSITSTNVTVAVLPADGIAPVAQYAAGQPSFDKARVWFSKPLDPATAQTAANYKVAGLTVTAAALVGPAGTANDNVVELTTTKQAPGQTYTVTITGVKDQMLPASTIAAASTVTFSSWALAQGSLRFEYYENIPGASDGSITTALSDPRVVAGTPTLVDAITGKFDTRTIFPDDSHEHYLAKISGFITPTETADYYFFLSSDDGSRLYLSKDETLPNPAVDTPIANEPGCCRAFLEPDSGQPVTTATPITLTAGKKYAVLALLKEEGGGDFLRVAWRKTTDATEAASLTPIDGKFLATYVDPNAEIVFKRQPVNQEALLPSTSINFANLSFASTDAGFAVTNTTPAPTSPWVYDPGTGTWTSNGYDSPGACGGPFNSRLLSTPFTVPADQAVTLSFSHRYSFEGDGFDGGQVLVSVNGGDFKAVAPENFTANGYATIKIQGNGVLKGLNAFNGDSSGFAAGNFITSSALLGTFKTGDKLVVQFLGAWDDCSGAGTPSWAIRSVALSYSSAPVAVTFDVDASVTRQGAPAAFTYQWQRDDGTGFANIAGATASSYRFFPTVAADFAASYRVLVGVPGNLVPSAVVKVVEPGGTPTLGIGTSGGKISITYTGTLQSAPSVTGPFTPVAGATSPYVPTVTGTLFFRSVK